MLERRGRAGRKPPLRFDGFRPEFLDFKRGIRVGHLESHQRITQILKRSLESKYEQAFVTDRWGRGIYWQWICFLSKANRAAKPISSHVNFGCSKFFIMIDREEAICESGLQIERGFLRASKEYPACQLRDDWDWHRLINSLKRKAKFHDDLHKLVSDGFWLRAGGWDSACRYSRSSFPSRAELLRALTQARAREWSGFQVYYPMTEKEVRGSKGADLVEAILAVFEEVRPLMNDCMQVRLDPKA